jgi:hypothetical protein
VLVQWAKALVSGLALIMQHGSVLARESALCVCGAAAALELGHGRLALAWCQCCVAPLWHAGTPPEEGDAG